MQLANNREQHQSVQDGHGEVDVLEAVTSVRHIVLQERLRWHNESKDIVDLRVNDGQEVDKILAVRENELFHAVVS